MKNKRYMIIIAVLAIGLVSLAIYFVKSSSSEANTESSNNTSNNSNSSNTSTTTGDTYSKTDIFTDRDLEQTVDVSDATKYTVSSGKDITITEEGIYVITGSATETTIYVEADDEAKVQLVLSGLNITNSNLPCIYVKSGDKVFITTTSDSSLAVTGTFSADSDTNLDGVIFSKSDLVLNGTAKLTINSSDNGIVSKDDLKITGGTYNITATSKGLEAHDSIAIADGTINIKAGTDGLHAEYDEDDSVGYIYISGGNITINAGDDGIHATTITQIEGGTIKIKASEGIEGTYILINDGTISIEASDDGINASSKSTKYSIKIEINGGNISINMGQGDTDAIDSNGDLLITGGTINITAQSPFDYDGSGSKTGGTLIVNGTETNTLSNQMMGGGNPGGNRGGYQMMR